MSLRSGRFNMVIRNTVVITVISNKVIITIRLGF